MIDYSNERGGKKAVVWTRVSTKYQEDNGGSLKTQEEICSKYARENKLHVERFFGGKHESAKTPGKMVKEMTDYVKRDKRIGTVIISEYDRFSRELWQATKMLEDLRCLGIVVVAAKFGMDTRTKEGMLMAQNTLAMAQWDNQNRTDKFTTGRIDCLKAGAWIEKVPRGYYKEGKSRETYCYLNDEGKVISMAFKWKLQGLSNNEIIEKMSMRGVKVAKQEIHKILVNPFYAGKIKHIRLGGELIDGRIEPAVSYKDYLKVQDILSGRTGVFTHAKDKDNCPLTKHVMCYADGTPFTSYTKHKQTKKHILCFDYYKCNKAGCKTNISAKEMHEKYAAILSKYDLPTEILDKFQSFAKEAIMQYGEESKKQCIILKQKLSEINNNIKNIKLRYATGKIDDDVYDTALQEYNNRKDIIELELERWGNDLSNLESKIPEVIKIASTLGSMWLNSNLNVKRQIQNLVFPEGIYWDKEIRGYRTHRMNGVFVVLDRLIDDFKQKKEAENSTSVPLCG